MMETQRRRKGAGSCRSGLLVMMTTGRIAARYSTPVSWTGTSSRRAHRADRWESRARFVNLIDQRRAGSGLAMACLAAQAHVVVQVFGAWVAVLRIVEAAQVVEAVLSRALVIAAGVKLQRPQRVRCNRPGQHGLAGAGLAGQKQGLTDGKRGVNSRTKSLSAR